MNRQSDMTELASELRALRARLLEVEAHHADLLVGTPEQQASIRNLLHYLALRQGDLRPLQERLLRRGLSTLGRAEAHVLATLDAVLGAVLRQIGEPAKLPASEGGPTFDSGPALLEARSGAVLGPAPEGRSVRIMVTLGREIVHEDALLRDLLVRGATLVRINCAHDDPDIWARMIESLRRAEAVTGRACRIEMDLGGPKLRTGPAPEPIRVMSGDGLLLTRSGEPGRPGAAGDGSPRLARIACSLPEVFEQVRPGERVFLDDGKICGVVEAVESEGLRLRISRAKPEGSMIKADRGINLPDTALVLPALTDKDREDLAFVARHADLVGLSFVQRPADLDDLGSELRRRDSPGLPLLLKIETQRAFSALPSLLLAALKSRPCGVMIARGDLAVECGYERLAEVQEEILWLCEAAHTPVVWATQVLERLAKKGLPTRAEVTDAAMAERAECVMLNKGPHLAEAVSLLDGILRRMEAHQQKKTARLRPLAVSLDWG